jgi:RNA polymerase sigma-70 factor (ECF subfamily)
LPGRDDQTARDTLTPEEALFAAAPAERRAALAELIERFSGRLFALARHMVGAAELAEELVQESLVRLWQRAIRPPKDAAPVTKVYGYLRRVLVNLTYHQHRPDLGLGGEADPDTPDPLAATVGREAEPAEQVIRMESTERCLAAIGQLPDEQRVVLALRVLEGRSYQQLADELGWPIGTVMSRLHRARANLADMLGEEADEQNPRLRLRRPG